jgi:hypothetical protein
VSADPTPTGTAAPKVFICYRREETAAYAGRLYDAAVARLGAANVFMDVDLAPGLDFVERITDAVGACKVLLVVMGPRWATVAHDGEKPRVADPEDYVRLEVQTALRRSEVTVIPVLVAGAQMPDRDDLPRELQPLTRRNALELSDARWRYDVGRLLDALDSVLAEFAAVREPPPPAPAPAPAERPEDARPAGMARQAPGRLVLEAMLVAGAAALVAGWIAFAVFATPKGSPSNLRLIALPIERRALVWAVTGGALVLWLTVRRGDGGLLGRALQGLLIGAIAGAVGGAIVGLLTHLPENDHLVHGSGADWVDAGSVAVTGAIIGALIGSRWLPASRSIGCAGGAIAGALVGLIFIPLSTSGTGANGLRFGFTAAAIAGLAVAFLLAVSARRRATADAPLRVPASDAAGKA